MAAAIGSGLVAGIFFAFSSFVMAALAFPAVQIHRREVDSREVALLSALIVERDYWPRWNQSYT